MQRVPVIDALLGRRGSRHRSGLPRHRCHRDADLGPSEVGSGFAPRAGPRALDLAIAAARPAIGPRAAEMAARVGELVGLSSESITVRGTTTDGLGFPGAEGIAAWAVAVVAPR